MIEKDEDIKVPSLAEIVEWASRDIDDIWHIAYCGQQFSDPKFKRYLKKIWRLLFYCGWVAKVEDNVIAFLICKLDKPKETFVIKNFGIYREFDDFRFKHLLNEPLRRIGANVTYKRVVAEVSKINPLIQVFFEKGFQEDPLAQQFYKDYREDYRYLSVEA